MPHLNRIPIERNHHQHHLILPKGQGRTLFPGKEPLGIGGALHVMLATRFRVIVDTRYSCRNGSE